MQYYCEENICRFWFRLELTLNASKQVGGRHSNFPWPIGHVSTMHMFN